MGVLLLQCIEIDAYFTKILVHQIVNDPQPFGRRIGRFSIDLCHGGYLLLVHRVVAPTSRTWQHDLEEVK